MTAFPADWPVVPWGEVPLDDLLRLETSSSPSPWSARQIAEERGASHSRGWALRAPDGRTVAFGVVWDVAGEAQVAELVVDPAERRRGLGRRLLSHLLERAAAGGARRATLEVRASNAAALALYAAAGFRETGRRPRFYGGVETAVLMEKNLDR